MQEQSVRTTVDIPETLYHKLKAQAAAKGSSVRKLVLEGVKIILRENGRLRRTRVRFPLIVSQGQKVDLTNEHVYEHVEFP